MYALAPSLEARKRRAGQNFRCDSSSGIGARVMRYELSDPAWGSSGRCSRANHAATTVAFSTEATTRL